MNYSRCLTVLLCFSFLACAEAREPLWKLRVGGDTLGSGLFYRSGKYEFVASLGDIQLSPHGADSTSLVLSLPGYQSVGVPGSPALPCLSLLFEGDQKAPVAMDYLEVDSVVIDLKQSGIEGKLAPYSLSARKGAVRVVSRPDTAVYGKDDWIGLPLLEVEYEGKLRDVEISSLRFHPVRYNPARDLLKVYYRVRVVLESSGFSRPPAEVGREFEGLLRRVTRLEGGAMRKAVRAEAPLTMVILSDTLFGETLQPLVEWKRMKGFRVLQVFTQDSMVGAQSHQIRQYLNTLYRDPPEGFSPPSFLLIVGDVQHIPVSQTSGQVTDLYYATYDGEGDYLPDLYYGRISVSSAEQLGDVVDKILQYEQYRFPDPSFLGESVLIAGVDGTFADRHGNGQIQYAGGYYLNESNGNRAHLFPYPESDTSDRRILDLISQGVGFVNYTGHGLSDRWINPTFRQDDIEELQNFGKYPVMIGNGCETNVFHLEECFAEALLRAPGKGAVAYIGCTNDSYWDEDFYWAVGVGPIVKNPLYGESGSGYYDRTFHLYGEPYSIWTPSMGEMLAGGNLSVQESTSPRKKFYWEIYQLAGDPSLVPWFREPFPAMVSHPPVIPVPDRRLDITCRPYSYAALSMEGHLLDAAHADASGTVTLSWPDSLPAGELDLVVTGSDHVPYLGKVLTGTPEGSYFSLLDHSLAQETVKADGVVTAGEQFSLNTLWVNSGSSPSWPDTLVAVSLNPQVKVADSMTVIGPVPAGDTLRLDSLFLFRAGTGVVDMDEMVLRIERRVEAASGPVYLRQKMAAPVLQSAGIHWDDRSAGNGNGVAEKGEWLSCSWRVLNRGHFRTGHLGEAHICQGSNLFETVRSGPAGIIFPGDTTEIEFLARVHTQPEGGVVSGSWMVEDSIRMVTDSLLLAPGRHFEDFRQGRIDRFPFENSGNAPWMIDSGTYHTGPFSIRSGELANFGISGIAVTVECHEPDTLYFSYRVSSEQGYDFLRFHVDSTLVQRWSGETGWEQVSIPLQPGTHKLEWTYQKDQSISRGEDAAWIDDLVFNTHAFRQRDLSLVAMDQPVSGPWLSGTEQVVLQLKNTGRDTVSGYTVRVELQPGNVAFDTIDVPVPPGAGLRWPVNGSFDLSRMGSYIFTASIGSEYDQFAGNNVLQRMVRHYPYPDLSVGLTGLIEQVGRCSEAVVELSNEGNTCLDTLLYGLWIAGSLVETGHRTLSLAPGESIPDTFLLADQTADFPGAGVYEFLIRSLKVDSVRSNNEVRGLFHWQPVHTARREGPALFSVFPNPASTGFWVTFPDPLERTMPLKMITSHGIEVYHRRLNRGMQSVFIPAGALSPGIYLLRAGSFEPVPVLINP